MKLNKINKLAASLLLSSTMALAPVSQAFAQSTHTVQEGEWLWGIARQYGLTAGDIMAANGLSSEWIDAGMQLYIPAAGYVSDDSYDNGYTGAASGVHVVGPGDTLSGIANMYGISVDQLMAWNGLYSSWLDVGDQLVLYGDSNASYQPSTPSYSSGSSYYTIQAGDTLSGIAAAYGTTVEHLMALNGLGSTWLVAGNTICVPSNGPVYVPDTSWTTPTEGIHVVQSGDTLSAIAWMYGVSEYDLWAWNNLATDWLNVGDVLYVGSYAPTTSQPVVEESTPVETPETEKTSTETDSTITTETTETEELDTDLKVRASTSKEDDQGQEILVSDLPPAARPDIHRVEEGESIDTIAVQYNTTADHLRKWNALATDDEVEVGQDIFVSNPLLIPALHTIVEGDTIESVAAEYDTLPELVREWNEFTDDADLVVGELMVASDPRPETHDVVAGETLEDVAQQYNITLEQLREWNNIPDRVLIVNGTVIVSDPTGKSAESSTTEEVSSEEVSEETTDESQE